MIGNNSYYSTFICSKSRVPKVSIDIMSVNTQRKGSIRCREDVERFDDQCIDLSQYSDITRPSNYKLDRTMQQNDDIKKLFENRNRSLSLKYKSRENSVKSKKGY
mmetsp:Transcript_17543/g.19734  ORF Transcript_17543/g.19734 Transcript_17543/m.19734 type:complete len:105 (-) Transcript_17543:441-755(-)